MTPEEREVGIDLQEQECAAYRATARKLLPPECRVDDGDDVDVIDERDAGGMRGAWVACWIWVAHD